MHVLVTGSSGQIGSYVHELASLRHHVSGIDRRPSPHTDQVADLRTSGALDPMMEDDTAIVHCAAQVSVQSSLEDPVADVADNVGGTVAVLDAARRHDAARVILVSSAAVYGAPARLPIQEDHPLRPLSPYGAAKVAAESYGQLWASLYGLDVVIVRPFNVYSVRQDPSNPYTGVMSKFADRVRAGRPPRITGDGSQTRDFIHAADVADWLVRCATGSVQTDGAKPMNLGSGEATSIRRLATLFLEAAALDLEPETMPRPAGEIDDSVADVTRARSHGWSPRIGLQGGIRSLLEGKEVLPQDATAERA